MILGRIKRTLGIGAAVIVVVIGGTIALANTSTKAAPIVQTIKPLPMTADLHASKLNLSGMASELIDANTGQILYAHNVTVRHYPASLVKMMTSLIAFDAVHHHQLTLNSIIPVDQNAFTVAQTPGLSVAYLNPSEKIPLWKMFEYMYIVSADDAAVALGDALGGSPRAFAGMMNQKAKSLGLTGTHYTNASGLQDPKQYTNAQDMAKLARYLINKDPIVLKYASMKGMYIHPGQYGPNYDQLLGQYQGLDGLKTGSTNQAGYCFVGTAKRGNLRLISVDLDAPSFQNVFQDTQELLDYGFQQFHQQVFQKANVPLTQRIFVKNGSNQLLQVAPHQNVLLSTMKGEGNPQVVVSTTSTTAPIKAGQQIGFEQIVVGKGNTVLKVPVYAVKSDPTVNFLVKIWRSVFASAHQGAKHLVSFALKKLGKL